MWALQAMVQVLQFFRFVSNSENKPYLLIWEAEMPGMPGPSQPGWWVGEAIPPACPNSRPTWPLHCGLVDQGYREVAAWRGGHKTETELVLRES